MIRVENVSRKYGRLQACSGISFAADSGRVTALVGPNGAGKSTILKMLSGILLPTSGRISLAGFDTAESPIDARRRTGTVFENAPLYGDLTVRAHLRFAAGMHGISGVDAEAAISRVSAICNLDSVLPRMIRELSKGFRQRVALAQALVHDPEILILDEPTSGLDPLQIADFRSLVRTLSETRTIVLSTHIMQEVESLDARVIMLNRGLLIADGTIADICAASGKPGLEEAFMTLARERVAEESL
jgi:ABC-2 type transport system ATP-binding protein